MENVILALEAVWDCSLCIRILYFLCNEGYIGGIRLGAGGFVHESVQVQKGRRG